MLLRKLQKSKCCQYEYVVWLEICKKKFRGNILIQMSVYSCQFQIIKMMKTTFDLDEFGNNL